MWRTLTVVSVLLVAVTCVSACGGGGDDDSQPADASPAPVPSGFVAAKSKDWSFVRPSAWSQKDVGKDEANTTTVVFESAPGTNGVPSQAAIGVSTAPDTRDLAQAVDVARTLNKARYQEYDITGERDFDVAGGKAHRIDATYKAFIEEPMTIKIVEIIVQMDDGRQMSFLVRGPEPDFDRLGLPAVVSSFRAT